MEFPISLEFTDKLKASIIVRKHCLTAILGNITTSYLEKKTSELLPLDPLIARVITQTSVHRP